MSDEPPDNDSADVALRFYLPPEQEAGVYAHAFAIWHTAYDFILDFGVVQLAETEETDDLEHPHVLRARVVSRVRVPPGLVFDLIRAINARMTLYEAEWGDIARPERQQDGE